MTRYFEDRLVNSEPSIVAKGGAPEKHIEGASASQQPALVVKKTINSPNSVSSLDCSAQISCLRGTIGVEA